MPLPERRERWQAMFDYLKQHDITAWRRNFLVALAQAQRLQGPAKAE